MSYNWWLNWSFIYVFMGTLFYNTHVERFSWTEVQMRIVSATSLFEFIKRKRKSLTPGIFPSLSGGDSSHDVPCPDLRPPSRGWPWSCHFPQTNQVRRWRSQNHALGNVKIANFGEYLGALSLTERKKTLGRKFRSPSFFVPWEKKEYQRPVLLILLWVLRFLKWEEDGLCLDWSLLELLE